MSDACVLASYATNPRTSKFHTLQIKATWPTTAIRRERTSVEDPSFFSRMSTSSGALTVMFEGNLETG